MRHGLKRDRFEKRNHRILAFLKCKSRLAPTASTLSVIHAFPKAYAYQVGTCRMDSFYLFRFVKIFTYDAARWNP